MYLESKKISLIALGITALACSRILFFFFNDPEGPNLLIVVVLAAVIYVLSLAAYFFASSPSNLKKSWLALLVQILVVVGLYIGLS